MSLDRKINRIQFLSGNSLKVIAVLTMLIDHLCKIVLQWLLSNYWGAMADNGQMSWERFREIDYFIRFDLQSIGTIAFPLFCFLLAEGFQHTRSKKRYIGLMLAFALISEVPFDIGFFSAYSRMEDTFPFYLKYQNVFFTLFLGLLTLVCLERFSCKSDLPVDRIKSAVLQVLSVVLFSGIAEGIHCDYGMQGILFISAFYICRNHRIYQVLLFLLAYMGTTGNQPPLCTLLACLLILLYNGKRGIMTQEMLFSKYAEQYPLTVPQEAVENELQLLILEEKQRIQYETLTGFAVHLSPQEELNKKMEELQAEALRRAKEMLVLREIMAAQTFPVTPEELEAEAAAIARRQNTTVAELKRFLGEDLAMLQSDLKKRKAAAWACEQMAAAK